MRSDIGKLMKITIVMSQNFNQFFPFLLSIFFCCNIPCIDHNPANLAFIINNRCIF